MLNIYYGRESVNKEKFIYDRIAGTASSVGNAPTLGTALVKGAASASTGNAPDMGSAQIAGSGSPGFSEDRRVLIIVPDQYTLEAERQAFRYLNVTGLVGLDVFSMSRLGHNILRELGGGRRTFIDKYGRQMLLTQIAREKDGELQVFKGNMAKNSFVELANDFISELKQYGVTPEGLRAVRDSVPEKTLLHRKLSDLSLIYGEYQKKIEGKYTDSEDYIDLYIDRIGRSGIVSGARIWVYGFDSFAPKSVKVLRGLMGAAEEVNIVLTGDKGCRDEELFSLTRTVMHRLIEAGKEVGCPLGELKKIGPEYTRPVDAPGGGSDFRRPAIAHLEHELYVPVPETAEDSDGITICEAANIYNEAESAAAFILGLIREHGYRYRDIVVICNDQSVRAQVVSRVFREYGIDLFLDSKRGILNSNPAIFLVSMLQSVANRYRFTDVMRTLKTGFTSLTVDEVERLENYALKYRIRGTMWKKPFEKGEFEYGADGMAALEELREQAMEIFGGLEEIIAESRTVRDFLTGFFGYLTGPLGMEEKLQEFMRLQEENDADDQAEETRQIFTMIIGLFDQIAELIGDEPFDAGDFIEIFTAGLKQIEIGVLPSSIDDLMMGTMQRTRSGQLKALVVLGANEGVLLAEAADEGLFSPEERQQLAEDGHEICKVDQIRLQEERLAIYRNMSRPSEHLWIGYSTGDEEGRELRRSDIVDTLTGIFPSLEIRRDIINREDEEALVGGRISTLRHLVERMRLEQKGVHRAPVWAPVERWYREHLPEVMEQIDKDLSFENRTETLPPRYSSLLFKNENGGTRTLSPSRIETYARCPFAYYVTYGLEPEERRIFQVASREIGDIYHGCLMRITARLSREQAWETVTKEECRELVRRALAEETEGYRDGLFSLGNEERYKTRRIEDTCLKSLWVLVEHARSGEISSSRFEVGFGTGRPIRPVVVKVGSTEVCIEGRIDRLDRLPDDRLKIIDYKSGNLQLKQEEVRAGYRLQLMLYMRAAQGDSSQTEPAGDEMVQEEIRRPAGVFYFHIQDPRVDGSITGASDRGGESDEERAERLEAELRKRFRLNGIMVDDPKVVREIAGEFEGTSSIAPVRITAGGLKGSPEGSLVSDEEFAELQEAVDEKVQEFVADMLEGVIDIHPMKTKDSTPCDYCGNRSICRFDLMFDGCAYNRIR